jgi:hypothetical protein
VVDDPLPQCKLQSFFIGSAGILDTAEDVASVTEVVVGYVIARLDG